MNAHDGWIKIQAQAKAKRDRENAARDAENLCEECGLWPAIDEDGICDECCRDREDMQRALDFTNPF